ncbi:MAG: hypothetical protein BMS9Abin12_0268 [Acidimicrobiia bacterium]|nr:MAG: hypothetical protein BMS9Abin12_0268 [Acidimicrobiia bacterium]
MALRGRNASSTMSVVTAAAIIATHMFWNT